MGLREHRQESNQQDHPVHVSVITVSDTRTLDTDSSGILMTGMLADAGHLVRRYEIVKDDPTRITALIDEMTSISNVIILNGGTGIAKRDSTFEAVDALLEKRLPGFGELFRMLSYQEIGTAAMLSRATAGTYKNTIIFSTPGSSGAVRLAMERLILPELKHLTWEIERQRDL